MLLCIQGVKPLKLADDVFGIADLGFQLNGCHGEFTCILQLHCFLVTMDNFDFVYGMTICLRNKL